MNFALKLKELWITFKNMKLHVKNSKIEAFRDEGDSFNQSLA